MGPRGAAARRAVAAATSPLATHFLALVVGLALAQRLRPLGTCTPAAAAAAAGLGNVVRLDAMQYPRGIGAAGACPEQQQAACPACPACPACQVCQVCPACSCPLGSSNLVAQSPQQGAIQGVAGDPLSTQLVEAIYWDGVHTSQQSFDSNGGLKDKKQISAGHGSKIRIWDYHGPFYNCGSRERVGKIGDGGKWVCGVRTFLQAPPGRPCVVYSIGSKGEVSFEIGVHEKLSHCELHVFDPTLTREQETAVRGVQGALFHNVGLGVTDGFLEISAERRRYLLWVQKTKNKYPVKRLATLMSELGHSWIDILKVDIEGGEWPVFEGLFQQFQQLPATQVQIELHFLDSIPQVQTFFQGMARLNFRIFSVEPNYYGRTAENARRMIEYSFIQVDPSSGAIVQGR